MNQKLDAKTVFYDWLEQQPMDCIAFLDQVCGQNLTLREEVEGLIHCYEAPDTFLDEPYRSFHASVAFRP